jgi:hypothetical protein
LHAFDQNLRVAAVTQDYGWGAGSRQVYGERTFECAAGVLGTEENNGGACHLKKTAQFLREGYC